ncbi:acyl-CoA dehydrogenase, partial [Pseudomonas sp. Pseusp3]
WLLVAARSEAPGADPRLSLAVIYRDEPGVRVEKLAPIPLMPDISHGRLFLDNALCELLAGDGWDAYVKPFRTLEDIYVLSAMTAWLYGIGQDCAWPQSLQLRLLGLLAGCAESSRQPPTSLAGHVVLGGLFAQFEGLKAEVNEALAGGPAEWAAMWQRDRAVMELAAGARGKRLAKALAESSLP